MDPTANLRRLREVAAKILRMVDGPFLETTPLTQPAAELAELTEALDQWIVRGGFLPEQWKRKA